jgi:hypothetical protein
VLGDKTCDNACWSGFEPFVASRASVEKWLHDAGQSYSVGTMGRKNDTLYWLPPDNPLTDPSAADPVRISMEFSEENVLWRISLLNIHICTETIISTYGIPDLINTDEQNIRLGYPSEGLLFSMHTSDASPSYVLSHVFITSAEWVEYFSSPPNETWENISAALDDEACEDAFSAR